MEQLFFEVLWRGVTAAVLILLVIFCRGLLRKAPRWVLCLLWLPVGIRLVLPVSIENPIGLFPGISRLYEAERVQKTEKAQIIRENTGYEAERFDTAAEEYFLIKSTEESLLCWGLFCVLR